MGVVGWVHAVYLTAVDHYSVALSFVSWCIKTDQNRLLVNYVGDGVLDVANSCMHSISHPTQS